MERAKTKQDVDHKMSKSAGLPRLSKKQQPERVEQNGFLLIRGPLGP